MTKEQSRESSGALPDVEKLKMTQRPTIAELEDILNSGEHKQVEIAPNGEVFVHDELSRLRADLQRVSEERDRIQRDFEDELPDRKGVLYEQVKWLIEQAHASDAAAAEAEASLSSLTAELQPLIERWKKEAAIEEQMAERNVSTGHDFAARQRRAEARRLLQCSRELSALLDRSRGTRT